jgi:RNA polymerase sigma factor for flagellar operon FliA
MHADTTLSRSDLIVQHMDLAKRIAGRMARQVPAGLGEDLQSAALLGLVEAAGRFDPALGRPFAPFAAQRIRGAILDELRRGDILPRRVRQDVRRVRHLARRMEHTLGRSAEEQELASELGMDIERYRATVSGAADMQVVSLDQVREQSLPGIESADPDRPSAESVNRALTKLDARDARIVEMHYEEHMTLAQIGKVLGVTESRVCQLHARAMRRLREDMTETAAARPLRAARPARRAPVQRRQAPARQRLARAA